MTEQALERAARALADHFGCEWETMRDADRDTIIGYVRAVLMAVREPTPKMVNATWNHPVDRDGGIESQNTRNERVYKAMIDAILEPTAPKPVDEVK